MRKGGDSWVTPTSGQLSGAQPCCSHPSAPWETPKSCLEGLSATAWPWERAGGGQTPSVRQSGGLRVGTDQLSCVSYSSGLGWGFCCSLGWGSIPWGLPCAGYGYGYGYGYGHGHGHGYGHAAER